ncbi:MAG: hypothetical protein EA397_10620 [Deltaproteobacteria bacterium]|nr:MAG: hypothetical protein EA397_10620 [Deltaproteobacteria bacterium]
MIDEQRALRDAVARLPIFPLPRTVLLPGSVLPLHVFEPRYRALVAFAQSETRGIFGIGTLKPGYEASYEGRPAIWPEVGVGRIVAHQPLPDGRCNIILKAIGRGILVQEHRPRHDFREIELALREVVPPSDSRAYDQVRALVHQIGLYSVQAKSEADRLLALEGSELLDGLARKLFDDVDTCRKYLREDHLEVRAAMVQVALADVLAAAFTEVGEA